MGNERKISQIGEGAQKTRNEGKGTVLACAEGKIDLCAFFQASDFTERERFYGLTAGEPFSRAKLIVVED